MRLFHALHRFRRVWHGITPSSSLSKAQFMTLMTIAHGAAEPATERVAVPMPLTVLAALQEQSLPGISQRVAGLEQMGYLERVPNPRDRRISAVQLTEQGEQLLKETCVQVRKTLNIAISQVGEQDMEHFLSLLQALTDALEQAANESEK